MKWNLFIPKEASWIFFQGCGFEIFFLYHSQSKKCVNLRGGFKFFSWRRAFEIFLFWRRAFKIFFLDFLNPPIINGHPLSETSNPEAMAIWHFRPTDKLRIFFTCVLILTRCVLLMVAEESQLDFTSAIICRVKDYCLNKEPSRRSNKGLFHLIKCASIQRCQKCTTKLGAPGQGGASWWKLKHGGRKSGTHLTVYWYWFSRQTTTNT